MTLSDFRVNEAKKGAAEGDGEDLTPPVEEEEDAFEGGVDFVFGVIGGWGGVAARADCGCGVAPTLFDAEEDLRK